MAISNTDYLIRYVIKMIILYLVEMFDAYYINISWQIALAFQSFLAPAKWRDKCYVIKVIILYFVEMFDTHYITYEMTL